VRYLLLVHSPVSRWDELPAEGTDADMEGHASLIGSLTDTERLVACSPLGHPATGRRVMVREGLATAVELSVCGSAVAGFYLIEARDLEDAIAVAQQIPDARTGHVEVRPLLPLEGIAGGPALA